MILKPLAAPLFVLLFCVSSAVAQIGFQDATDLIINDDIISMIKTMPSLTLVISKIKTSKTHFETSPAVLAKLKQGAVPESVISSTIEVEPSESVSQQSGSALSLPRAIGIPAAEPAFNTQGKANCETFDGGSPKNGVVWCGSGHDLPFNVLAERSAPILWFSSDEQLLEKKYKIPQPIPCDSHSALAKPSDLPCKRGDYCGEPLNNKSAVVYYQIRRIIKEQASTEAPFVGKNLKLDRIEKLTMKYYFYYCVDCGFGGHRHDLENIELEILIEKEKNGPRYRARVAEVIGSAHGVHWYNNRLKVKDDTVFPITILVEEGKHASAPDNDGGGTYEHRTDINKRVRDAWGLRDTLTLREWVPLFPYYLKRHTNQNRPKKLKNRVGSKAQIESHPDIWANYRVEIRQPGTDQKVDLKQPEEVYELRELGSDCTAEKVRETGNSGKFDLAGALERRRAGKDPAVAKPSSKIVRTIRSSFLMEEDDNLPENLWEKALQFSYRYDGSHGFSLTPTLPMGFLFRGYLIPRAHFSGFTNGSRRYGLDYLFTPSASRWVDFYVAGGIEWYRERPGRPFKYGPAWEGGIKFRFPISIKKKLFVGVRVGLRTSPARKLSPVIEPGGGLF
jgi:hypothetical protein